MPILTRYVLRESSMATVGVAFTLLLIMLANLLARALAQAADGTLPTSLIPALMGFNTVKLLIYVLPVGLFIGLMFALGRMSRDSELTVLRACGFGVSHLSRAVLWLAIPVSLLTAAISLVGYPALQQVQAQMLDSARNSQIGDQLPVGRFIEDPSGKAVLYIGSKVKGGYTDIFAFNEPIKAKNQPENNPSEHNPSELGSTHAGQKPGVEMAPFGKLTQDTDGHRYVVLAQGRRIQGLAGESDWTVVDYQTHEILVPGGGRTVTNKENQKSSLDLLRSPVPGDQAEFFYRLSQALTVLVLALIAVPLAQSPPRSGRYGRLFWAFLIYAIYFNVIAMVENVIKSGDLTLLAGLAITHGLFIGLWSGLLWWMNGGGRRLKAHWRHWLSPRLTRESL
ncbi:MAG: LPS export ABC transporter permease LptF [Halothiobacillus sp.]